MLLTKLFRNFFTGNRNGIENDDGSLAAVLFERGQGALLKLSSKTQR
jgi:hypothetical protein